MLAARGGRVLLGCREEAKAETAIAQIRDKVAEADLKWVPLDLAIAGSGWRAFGRMS